MGFKISKQSGHTAYGVVELMVDTEAEIANLPTTFASGSVALCISTSEVYVLNSQKVWCKL